MGPLPSGTAVFQLRTALCLQERLSHVATCRRGLVTQGADLKRFPICNSKKDVGTPLVEREADSIPPELEKKEGKLAPRLPWAVDFKSQKVAGAPRDFRASPVGAFETPNVQLSEGKKGGRVQLTERKRGGRVQLFGGNGGGRSQKQSARQRLIAIDKERGEELGSAPKRPPARDFQLQRRHFQRGENADLREEARVIKAAVVAILKSQSLGSRTEAATFAAPGLSESAQMVSPRFHELSDFERDNLWTARNTFGESFTCATPNEQLQKSTQSSNQRRSELPAGSALRVYESQGCAHVAGKQAALARTLDPLAGSLSLFRWQDVLKDLGACGQWALALDVFKWMQANLRLKPNAFTYGQMAMVLQAAGQLSPLLDLYHNALSHNITPPQQLYNAAILAHCQRGALEKGLEVFALMKEAGCKPGQWTYVYLLGGIGRSILDRGLRPVLPLNDDVQSGLDSAQGGEDVLERGLLSGEYEDCETVPEVEGADEFVAIRGSLGASKGTHRQERIAVLLAVDGTQVQNLGANVASRTTEGGKSSEWVSQKETGSKIVIELAENLVAEMLASGVRHSLFTLSSLAQVYARGGHVAKALGLLGRMSEHFGLKPDADCFVAVLYACAEGGGTLDQLLDVYRGMIKERITPPGSTFYPLLRACAEEKDLSIAYELFADISRYGIGPDARHYTSLVHICGVVGDLNRAEDLPSEMIARGVQPTVVTWNVLLGALQKGGASFAQLKPVVDRMKCSLNCMTYSILLRACKEEGRVNTAQRIYTNFLAQEAVAGSRTHVHLEAMDIFARAGMVEACEAVTAHMQSEGLGFTKRAHEVLIGAYAAVLNYPMMAKSLKAMLDEGLTPGIAANGHLARALAKGGRVDELLLLLESIREGGGEVPVRMWHYVIRAYMNVPDQAPDFVGLARTLLDLHRTSAPLPFGALVSIVVLISQADTWQSVEPLILLLSQHNNPLFQTAYILLAGNEKLQKRDEDAGADLKGEPLDVRLVAHEFVRIARGAESDTRLQIILFGRLADALWFRGLRNRAAILVHTFLTHELDRPFGELSDSQLLASFDGSVRPRPLGVHSPRFSEPWRIDLHNISEGGACALLLSWLRLRQADVRRGRGDPPRRVEIITGWGKHALVGGLSSVQEAVTGCLKLLDAPFKVSTANEGVLAASGESVREWLDSCPVIELKDERI